MFRSKKDVDKYVDNLISKLSAKEFKTRAAAVARMYYDVGDFASCQRYIEQNLAVKDNNAAGHRLLGQALQKMGQKEKALEHYKISLDIDPTQPNTILDICQLLADDDMTIDPGRARYWCEKAEAIFPKHPVTFSLREKLLKLTNPDPEAYVKLLTAELSTRPKDALLHCRLLKHYLHVNQIKEAFDHSCNIEFGSHNFLNNYLWYDTLAEILKHNSLDPKDWLYQLLLLTVRERMCVLSLTEIPSGSSKSLLECSDLLHLYDQSLELIAKTGAPSEFGKFHAALLQHHRGQFAFHAATFLLKKAKKDQISWREATTTAAPLMLIAWQTVLPLDPKVNWIQQVPEKLKVATQRWYREATFKCSQAGHYLLSNIQDKSQSFLDKISQTCSGTHWRDKIYEKLFTSQAQMTKIKSSHFVSDAYTSPVLRLPRRTEVEAYDVDAQTEYPNSLHHFVWILLNYKNYAHFKCTLFDMLTPNATYSGPETLSNLDTYSFLYLATLTSQKKKSHEINYIASDKPSVLPANITDMLCSLSQMKWWDCAYKYSQNELGSELTDIRKTLSGGMEVVRCIDNHGLDPELLCLVARIFSERAKLTTVVDEKSKLELRAGLYYSSALPLLEKLKSKMLVKMPEKRLFDYTHNELETKEINSLLEESKLYVAINHLNECEYDKVINLLSNLKSPEAYYNMSQAYRKLASEENNLSKGNHSFDKSKYSALMSKAKHFAYKALDKMKDSELSKNHPLYFDVQQLIEEIEIQLNKFDPDLSGNNDIDGKYSSDENSLVSSEHIPMRNNHLVSRNLSSTPKHPTNLNSTKYRTAVDTQVLETTRADSQFFEKIENQIMNFQRSLADSFMEQTKGWFEENKRLGNQIMSTIQSDIQNTTDQFKLLKISVDQVKDQIDECRNECKDVGDLKKQVAELKKEVNKLKKASSEQTIDESDLYNLDDDYRNNDSSSSFAAQLPFQTQQVVPPFNPKFPFPVPPIQSNPYQMYTQSLYNLYNQYSQFSQASVPGAPPLFDPTKLGYAGVYPTPDQMYLDVAHLVPPPTVPVPAVSSVPTVPPVPTLPTAPPATAHTLAPTSVSVSKPTSAVESKESTRALPVNVVITSSDPLPTCTTAPPQILSVTIPSKHIKGTPHNYQIPMPPLNENSVVSPPVFSFPAPGNKSTTASTLINWTQSNMFKTSQPSHISVSTSIFNTSNDKSIDGIATGASANTSLNKSRTLSEKSNTSIDNYDPCPDFKPIIPLPAEVQVTTGEEDEVAIFCDRAKLFRFADQQWKERGIGEMKLLKHKVTGKVRVLMRREQIHKICANHVILPEMQITPMKNETKAYFWVANDFADEQVVLEKFCIRFKTADIAHKFYETFEKARQESKVTNTPPKFEHKAMINNDKADKPAENISQTTPIKSTFGFPAASQPNKTEFGGFKFSSTPTFKVIEDDTKSAVVNPTEPVTSKVNVFSALSFKTTSTTSSPFSNLFGTTSSATTPVTPVTNVNSPLQKQDTPNKLNTSDVVEEYEPNIEFKPIIPLPALVDQKTGEEDENILFEHRAKLLRYDAATKEWKERGLGNIKLLIHKENPQKVRLLMRREQIMKVCCNHAITKEMTFEKMPKMDKAVTWCAKDFSDGELVAETFCLRFKTVQICDEFMLALKLAQSKMKDDSKAAKEEQNAAKQNNQEGFGDKFKPKPGSWRCDACYTNNLENFLKCGCCEQPKPGCQENEKTNTTAVATGWGDKFKPKAGSWECSECLIRNEGAVNYCTACNNPKDPSIPRKDTVLSTDNSAPKFSFGIPPKPISSVPATTSATVSSTDNSTPKFSFGIANQSTGDAVKAAPTAVIGFGDKFKPKEGSWECEQCFIRNESNIDKCAACNSPRDPNAVKNTNNNQPITIFGNVATGPKFSFGIPPSSNIAATPSIEQKPKTDTTSIFDGTGAHKFSFGVPFTTPHQEQNIVSFGQKTPTIFGTPKSSTKSDTPLNLTSNKVGANEDQQVTPAKPALLPTPQAKTLGDEETHNTFDFVFKPKTPPKGKSPMKSKGQGDESDGNEYASEDEGHHIHFSPVVPLPDKVEVVTGEENEVELYGHRAKLYRFMGGEWKERGIGIVKILKHNDTGKLRVVMRREQVLKICLNHALSPEITYTNKDDKTWLFAANDFSEGELSLQQFCLRFKTKEIASEFKDTVDKARAGKAIPKKESETGKKDSDSDDVVFVREISSTDAEKERAKELMLPENFYTYQSKEPCKGCRGCQDDDEKRPAAGVSHPVVKAVAPSISVETPVKTPTSFQSPMNSFYGTPANFDNTVDTSVFRTPLGSIGSNTNAVSPATSADSTPGSDSTNKENTLLKKNIFGVAEQSNIFTTPQSKQTNIFGVAEAQNSGSTKGSILAAPKLNTLNTSGEEIKKPEAKSIFGSAQTATTVTNENMPVFGNGNSGISSNKSIFSLTGDGKSEANPAVKSIFWVDDQKPVNLFSGAAQGSIFGPGALSNTQQKSDPGQPSIFGTTTTPSQVFGSQKSIFETTPNQTQSWTFGSAAEETKPDAAPSVTPKQEEKKEIKSATETAAKDSPFKIDNSLSFAALSSGNATTGFTVQKKSDFQWEGAGQQLFTAAQRAQQDKSKNDSGAADESGTGADEEYDPHYEPIVPLPEKIVVTTGEEDEEKMFGERCKLYRYDDKTKEWKERGVGEMKILYHPERKTYRLLLRREQVHKAVLNQLIFMDMELLPMKNSDRAWSWAGRNFAENPQGEQETLAVRFKSLDLATSFKDKVTECTRKLQAAAAQAIKEEKEAFTVAPLRLPKHLESSARADSEFSVKIQQQTQSSTTSQGTVPPNGDVNKAGESKQVHFEEPEEDQDEEEVDEDEYDHEYYQNDDYYYNEDEEESAAYYECVGEATVTQGASQTKCDNAHIQVLFDQDCCSPKILVTDVDTGEALADMLIHTDTEFQMAGTMCSWSGKDYTSNDPVDKTVSVDFHDDDTALQFYDSCETSKGATYSSTDPES